MIHTLLVDIIWLSFAIHAVCFTVMLRTMTDGERMGGALLTALLLFACLLVTYV